MDDRTMTEDTTIEELEGAVLREALVSAMGLTGDRLQIGIKGDPSLRETALARPRYTSAVDEMLEPLLGNLEDLLLNRGTYNLFLGFNNCEIRTSSVFDPLRTEIHEGQRMVDRGYIDRHFPGIDYPDKVAGMRELYDYLGESRLYERLPEHWRRIFARRHDSWQPMQPEEIRNVFATLGVLRAMPDYYLRNATINLVQSVVRLQFNCDGTQLVRSGDIERFLTENLTGA
jgi:hypothetical protein